MRTERKTMMNVQHSRTIRRIWVMSEWLAWVILGSVFYFGLPVILMEDNIGYRATLAMFTAVIIMLAMCVGIFALVLWAAATVMQ